MRGRTIDDEFAVLRAELDAVYTAKGFDVDRAGEITARMRALLSRQINEAKMAPTKLGRSNTAAILGDPPPGRSALETRKPWTPTFDDKHKSVMPKATKAPRGRAALTDRVGPIATPPIAAVAIRAAGLETTDAARAMKLASVALALVCTGSPYVAIGKLTASDMCATFVAVSLRTFEKERPKWAAAGMLERVVDAVQGAIGEGKSEGRPGG